MRQQTNIGKYFAFLREADESHAATPTVNDRAVGWMTLASGIAISAFLYWRNHTNPPMPFSEYNLLNTSFILWIPLLVILFIMRRDPAEFGMCPGELKAGMKAAFLLFILFIPVILLISPQSGSQTYYLNWMGSFTGSNTIQNIYYDFGKEAWSPGGRIDYARLAYHELAMGFYMFGWEFFFRGFLLNGIRRIAPLWAAILFQAVIFTALHWGKPLPEVASSFPGGILMALLALRYRSFLPCFLLHWLVSAGFDIGVLFFHFRGSYS